MIIIGLMMTNKEILNHLDELIPNPKCSLNYTKDYELLIATMLSAQSTDARVNQVTEILFKYNLDELSKMDINEIEMIIKPVGTYHRKALYIKKIAEKLLKEQSGLVPNDREYVENLPGVGHKTCNVVFAEIYKEQTIPVDTHVSRVSKRLNLAKEDDDVLIIENKLMNFFPKESWNRLHLQLVLFGRHKCTARNPNCNDCPFKNTICKYNKKMHE